MKSLLTFNLGRHGRALAALALAGIALAILLLGVGSEPPTASASTLPPPRPENVTVAISTYLPLILHTTPPPLNWVDHFKSSKTGWVAAGEGCTGEYDTAESVYRVKISAGHENESCIIWNSNPKGSPLYPFPRQFYGTFLAKVKRTSSDSYPLRYGLQFDTAVDSTDTSGTRWALEEYPQTEGSQCDEGFYWLTAQQYKSSTSHTDKYFSVNHEDESPPGDDVSGCTSAIELDQSDWNEMAAVRVGGDVKVYLRNFKNDGGTEVDHTYSHTFVDVPAIVAKNNDPLGWVQMRVVSLSDSAVTVEFERVEIHSSTSAPW